MRINRFLNNPDKKPFHSNVYARVAHGETLGSTSTESFGQRYGRERKRQAVARYKDSMVANGNKHVADRAVLGRSAPSVRSRLQQSSSHTQPEAGPDTRLREQASTAPKQVKFVEPPKRGYNPYK